MFLSASNRALNPTLITKMFKRIVVNNNLQLCYADDVAQNKSSLSIIIHSSGTRVWK